MTIASVSFVVFHSVFFVLRWRQLLGHEHIAIAHSGCSDQTMIERLVKHQVQKRLRNIKNLNWEYHGVDFVHVGPAISPEYFTQFLWH